MGVIAIDFPLTTQRGSSIKSNIIHFPAFVLIIAEFMMY